MSEQPVYLLAPPERSMPLRVADERETLTSFLDFQRATLAVKCTGLTADQLRGRTVPPSTLSLLGLVRHMADVERNWFTTVLGGQPMGTIFGPGVDFDLAFTEVADADVAEAFAVWEAECVRARELTAAAASLDVTGDRDGRGTFSLRWVLIHMIEEYARHNGHADLIRERIDGATGQ
jgi:uncharacterized damage-inducible protein DinB